MARLLRNDTLANYPALSRSYRDRNGDDLTLETSVTGTVSLEAGKKGINMSRIMRSFYKHADRTSSFEVIEAALNDDITDLDSIQMRSAS